MKRLADSFRARVVRAFTGAVVHGFLAVAAGHCLEFRQLTTRPSMRG